MVNLLMTNRGFLRYF